MTRLKKYALTTFKAICKSNDINDPEMISKISKLESILDETLKCEIINETFNNEI